MPKEAVSQCPGRECSGKILQNIYPVRSRNHTVRGTGDAVGNDGGGGGCSGDGGGCGYAVPTVLQTESARMVITAVDEK